jgi:hypothetical protein
MMNRLADAAGFRLDPEVREAGTDQPFAALLRKLDQANPLDRARLIRRFPATAQLALVAKRAEARRVRLDGDLGGAVEALERQGQKPVLSSLEALAEDASRTRSFTPVVYVEDPERATGFEQATKTSRTVMFLLPTTDNVRSVTRETSGIRMVSPEWALLDSLASPGRQADATADLLDLLMEKAA